MRELLLGKLGLAKLSDERNSVRFRQARLTSVAQLANRILNTLVKFITIPLAVTILGREEYGVWLTLLSLVAWLSVSDLGLPAALINPLAQAIGKDDSKRTRELISTTFFLLSGVGLVIGGLCIGLALVLPLERILGLNDPTFSWDVRLATIVVVAISLGALVLRLTDAITLAMQKGYWGAIEDSVALLISLLCLVSLKIRGGGLTEFALAITLPSLFGRLGLWGFLIYRFGQDFAPHIRNISRQALRNVGVDGLTFFAGTWGELLVLQTPNIVIAQLLGAAAVPLFAIPYQLFYSAYVLLNTIATPLWPAYAEAKSKHDWRWIRLTHWRVMRESMLLALVGFTILFVGSSLLIQHWVGAEYVPPMILLAILALQFIQWTWNYVFAILLTGLGFIRERVGIVLVFGVLNVILSVALTQKFGITGIAASLFVSMLLTQTWFLAWVIFRRAHWVFDKGPSQVSTGEQVSKSTL